MALPLKETDTSRYSSYVDDAFYHELIGGLQDWQEEGLPVDENTRSSCKTFLFQEARLLDNGQFDAWLKLFTPMCLYWVPSVIGGGDPRREVSIVFDDRRRLEDRVFWLQCGFAYSQTPPSRTSRMISNIEVFQGSTSSSVRVRSNFIVYEFRQGKGRSLVNRPKVLLLDEPLSALDAQIREALRQELRQLQRQTGITFVYVTHDQEEALALSDRIAVMHNGRIEQIGTPSAIYNSPASAFVARFIGQANFLTGRVVAYLEGETTETVTVEVNNVRIKASPLSYVLELGSEVTLMIRPERISTDIPNLDNSIMGKLIETTYIGQRIESVVETSIGQLKMVRLSDGKVM